MRYVTTLILLLCIVGCSSNTYDTLYVKGAVVYEGNVGTEWVMTTETLKSVARTFVGKPVLISHNWIDPNQCIGYIIEAGVRHDETLDLYYLEIIMAIKSPEAMSKITNSLYRSLSAGLVDVEGICTLDDQDYRVCPHRMGTLYRKSNGTIAKARATITRLTGMEVSFINVPASVPARVLESSYTPIVLSDN